MTVFRQTSGADLTMQAAAAGSAAGPHVAAARQYFLSAIAKEEPMRVPAPALMRIADPDSRP